LGLKHVGCLRHGAYQLRRVVLNSEW
jgi:hypothetical protein